jgi:hypothetical protein
MELLALQKKCVLIPTPGQTEQEYLSKHLMQQRWCYCCSQEEDLLTQLEKAKNFEFHFPVIRTNNLKSVVEDLLCKEKSV